MFRYSALTFNSHRIHYDAPFATGHDGLPGVLINGSARTVGGIAGLVRLIQTGHLYWYALVMILGVVGLMTWQLWPHMVNQLMNLFGR